MQGPPSFSQCLTALGCRGHANSQLVDALLIMDVRRDRTSWNSSASLSLHQKGQAGSREWGCTPSGGAPELGAS